jgi:hypothetical protein
MPTDRHQVSRLEVFAPTPVTKDQAAHRAQQLA